MKKRKIMILVLILSFAMLMQFSAGTFVAALPNSFDELSIDEDHAHLPHGRENACK